MNQEESGDLNDFIRATAVALAGAPERRSAWQAAIQTALREARAGGDAALAEAQLFTALNDLLDGKEVNLPVDHPYANVLAEVRAQAELEARSDEQLAADIFQAVQALLAADDWQDTRCVMELHQRILLLPQTDDLFNVFIRQSQAQKDEEAVKVLRLHLRLVQIARQHGIPAAFARLEAALKR